MRRASIALGLATLVACSGPATRRSPSAAPVVATPSPAPPPGDSPSEVPCAVDADCVVTNFAGCCEPCRVAPHVERSADARAAEEHCAIVDCEGRVGTCPPVEPAEEYRAVCRQQQCAMVKR